MFARLNYKGDTQYLYYHLLYVQSLVPCDTASKMLKDAKNDLKALNNGV